MATSEPPIPGSDHAALIPLGAHAGAPPIVIKRPITAIGSRKDAVRIHLDSSTVSKIHCVIVLNDWGCYIHDTGSRTHTWVNAKQVVDANLADGDLLQVGRFKFKYVAPTNVAPLPPMTKLADSLDVSTLSDPLPLQKRVIQIGRRVGSDLQLDDNKISNIHAVLFTCNGIRFVRDLASRTGTWLDGQPVHQEALYDGSELKLGGTTLVYRQSTIATEADDEIDLSSEPLTLHEAIPSASIGFDAAAPLELESPKLTPDGEVVGDDRVTDDLVIDDLVADDDLDLDLTSEGSNDALADLRRNWQAPARHVAPPEPPVFSEPISEAPVPVPVSDITVSHAPAALPIAEKPPEIPEIVVPEPISEPVADTVADAGLLVSDETVEAVADDGIESSVDDDAIELSDAVGQAIVPEVAPDDHIDLVQPAAEIAPEPEIDLSDLAPLELEPLDFEAAVDEEEIALDLSPLPEPSLSVPSVSDVSTEQEAIAEALTPPVSQVSDTAPPAVAEDALAAEDMPLILSEEEAVDEVPPAAMETVPSPDAALADLDLDPDSDLVLDLDSLDLDEVVEPLPAATVVEASEIEAAEAGKPAVAAELPVEVTPEANVESEAEEDDPLVNLEPAAPETVALDAITAPASIFPPTPQPVTEVPLEIDAVDLSLDLDEPYEVPDDATALAVDFGLDELDHADDDETDHHVGAEDPDVADRPAAIDFTSPALGVAGSAQDLLPPEHDAEASEPAEAASLDPLDLDSIDLGPIDLESPASESIDLSQLESLTASISDEIEEDAPTRPLIDLADTMRGQESVIDTGDVEDIFEAESVDVVDETAAAPAMPTAEVPDEIAPPKGGALSDLIPNGPPLLGGAFTGDLHGPVIGGSPSIDFTKPQPKPDPKRRGPLRVGFPGNGKPRGGSPFASNTPSIGDMFVGRRGGASVDVFANPSPTPEELQLSQSIPESAPRVGDADDDDVPAAAATDLADVTLSQEQREILQTAEAFRPRAPISIETPINIPPMTAALETPAQRAAAHKKRLGRVIGSLVLMFLLTGATVAGVYNYVPVYSTLEGLITFGSLDRLGADDARQFHEKQNDNLQSEAVRQDAVGSLPQGIAAGFLSDVHQMYTAIDRDPKTLWPVDQPTVMRVQCRSTDKGNDIIRLRALSQAIIDASAADIANMERLRAQVDSDLGKVRGLQSEISRVNSQLQALQQAGDKRPDPAQIAALQTERQKAEDTLRAIRSSRQELEATQDRLTKDPAAPALAAVDVNAAAADQDLAKLNTQLSDLQQRGQMMAANTDEKSAVARKSLDDTIADVQQSMQTAQKLRDNPDLVAYVESANRLFKLTRQLTEDSIRRQENTRTRLIELKSTLSDRIAAQTNDLLSKDEQLKKFNDNLAIGTRQFNAAVSQGYSDEAKKIELQNSLFKALIAARTEVLTKDPSISANGEAIDRIQQMIQQQENSIAEDRKQINETIATEQDNFMKHAPAVDKMPAEQKALAEALEQKLGAVSDARKAYDAASEKAQAEQAKIDAELKEKTTAVQLEIAARKHDLALVAQQQQAKEAAVARQKQLDSTNIALADARTKESAAQKKLDAATATLESAEKLRRDFTESDADREAKIAAKAELEHNLQIVQSSYNTHQADRAKLIVPDSKFEVVSYDNPDRRLLLASAASGLIFVLLMIPVGWNLILLWRDAHPHHPATPAMPSQIAEGSGSGFDPILEDQREASDASDAESKRDNVPLLASAHA